MFHLRTPQDIFEACREQPRSMSRQRYRASITRLAREQKRWRGAPGPGVGGWEPASATRWSPAKRSSMELSAFGECQQVRAHSPGQQPARLICAGAGNPFGAAGRGIMSQELDTSIDQGEEEIAAIREVRHRLSEQFGHDPYRLVAHLIDLQKEHPEKLVPAPPR